MKGQKTGGGSRKGIPNKASAEIKEVARQYGSAAVHKLAEMAGLVDGVEAAQSEQARVAANKEILDRGYGKATQTIAGDNDSPLMIINEAATSLDAKLERITGVKREEHRDGWLAHKD